MGVRVCSQIYVYDLFVDQSTSIGIYFIVKGNPVKVVDYCYCSSSTLASIVVRELNVCSKIARNKGITRCSPLEKITPVILSSWSLFRRNI